jgi:hypothetical protein
VTHAPWVQPWAQPSAPRGPQPRPGSLQAASLRPPAAGAPRRRATTPPRDAFDFQFSDDDERDVAKPAAKRARPASAPASPARHQLPPGASLFARMAPASSSKQQAGPRHKPSWLVGAQLPVSPAAPASCRAPQPAAAAAASAAAAGRPCPGAQAAAARRQQPPATRTAAATTPSNAACAGPTAGGLQE